MKSPDDNRIPIPSVLDRALEFMRLQYINNPSILGYRLRVANSLNNAYGNFNGVGGVGTFAIIDVNRDGSFISKELKLSKRGLLGETNRGQTRLVFNPNEYFGLDPVVPADGDFWYVRTQVRTVASPTFPVTADNLNQSDILVVRPPGFMVVPRPAMTLYGTAPDLATAAPGLPAPQEALVVHVPNFGDAMVLTNHGPGVLYYSVGYNYPLIRLDAGQSISHASGMKDELVFCSNGSNPSFSLLLSTVTGIR
jgi:hypothetical protein